MRAVWYSEFGSASEVLTVGELETPEPGAGEVRVRVSVSGVNPVDVKRRAGGRGATDTDTDRVIPHFDGAGVVDSVGDRVNGLREGDRVWVYEAQWQRSLGSAAEYVVLPEHCVVRLPGVASFEEGASLGIPALTAHRCVFRDGPVTDQTILVTGGAGAVGHYAVQFAKLGGARVLTSVSTEDKASLARKCNADEVINYKNENVSERVRELTGGAGVDRVVDVEFGGNLTTSVDVLKPNGVIAAYASDAVKEPTLPFYQLLYGNVTLRCELVFLMEEDAKLAAIDDITGWLETNALTHNLGPSFPLEETAAAHEAVEAATFGKVIVSIPE
jgi:NADPH2:quinone reductase